MNLIIGPKETGMKVGDMAYGTLLRYNGSFYIKVDKHKVGEGLHLGFNSAHSVLVNVKLGTLRQVPGNTKAEPIADTDFTVELLSNRDYHLVHKNNK